MPEQINNSQNLISIIDAEPYQFRNEWEKTSYEKVSQMYKLLEGLNLFKANQIIESLKKAIENNAIIS